MSLGSPENSAIQKLSIIIIIISTKAHRIAPERRKQRSQAYFSEMSSISATDRLFSVTYGPFVVVVVYKGASRW